MQENESKKKQSSPSHPPRGVPRSHVKPRSYPVETRLKAVRLHLEQRFSLGLIAQELGVHKATVAVWVRRYRKLGEAGLQIGLPFPGSRRAKLPAAVSEQIVSLKQQQPSFGVRKISQWLRRVLVLPASPETVRRTLHQKQLIDPARRKPKRNPPKPRFFERATPNQLWQSDIFTFRLGGKNAYLIGFIDDHSRYLVGLDLFRSQTSEHVLEVYRTAVGEYGVGAVYETVRDQIIRRTFQELVEAARREAHHQHQARQRHIHWRVPGLVWPSTTPHGSTNFICCPSATSPAATATGPWSEITSSTARRSPRTSKS